MRVSSGCSVATTARTSPDATCAPGSTLISVTVPSCGAVTVCCIFMASRTRTASPAETVAPTSATTFTTVPGIGASREPLATASAGSVKRGTSRSRTDPTVPSTQTSRVPVRRSTSMSPSQRPATPSTSSLTRVGETSRTLTPSTAKPSRVPHHSTGSWPSKVVRCGWLTTLRQAAGTPCWTVRRSASAAASIRAPATRFARPLEVESPGDSAEIGRDSSHVVVISPATKTGSLRISTSWSRLVVTPWMRAWRRAATSIRTACSRVGAHAITLASIAS